VTTTPAETAWHTWHEAHEAARSAPHGFLAVTSIHWLTAGPERFDDAPGTWWTGPDGPVVELDAGERLTIDGGLVTGTHRFGSLGARSTTAFWDRPEGVAGSSNGGVRVAVEVANRGGSDIVRPRHPDALLRTTYRGTPTFPFDERFVVRGTFVPFDAPREVSVGSVVDGLRHAFTAPGVVRFDLDGPREVVVFGDAPAGAAVPVGDLTLLFRDRTSGVTTYAACRTLDIDAPAADGTVTLDFTRATNLPCAYTPHATCPLPPPENRLDVAIEAGEQLPR
jgi:uncharacterized protein